MKETINNNNSNQTIENRYIEDYKSQIPKDAKCVFKGILFNVYHFQRETLDKTKNDKITYEIVKRHDNAQILFTLNNKIILVKEMQPHFKKPQIGLPGGNIENGEKSEDAAIREILEETGIKVNKIKLFATDSLNIPKIERTFYLYLGYNCKKIGNPQNTNSEKIELLELDFEDFIKETQKKDFRNPRLREIIKDIIKRDELREFKKLLFNYKN